jgi:MIP family channel proteins
MTKKHPTDWYKKYLAEMIGTFFFLLGGFGAAVAASMGIVQNPDLVVPLAFGGSLMVTIFALGHISGGHFNPAVTIGLAAGGHFPAKRVMPYIISQTFAAVMAALLLFLLFGAEAGYAGPVTVPNYDMITVGIFEALGTFLLVFVIASIATDKRTNGIPNGLAIGGTLFTIALSRGWIGGGSFNPARTLGTAITHYEFTGIGVYMIAPIVGGILAVLAYNLVSSED